MSKFYAVKKGRKTGIFHTWDECKEQISGFKGAVFKSFPTELEALNYLGKPKTEEEKEKEINEIKKELFKSNTPYAYIDGSFDSKNSIYGSGVVIVINGEYHEIKHAGNNAEYAELHNVAGEIEAAKYVMYYAALNSIPEITIFYDYKGIESWATGEWKAKLRYTQDYVKYYSKIAGRVKINFVKVKAHTGVKLNERVDTLAKEAIAEYKIKHRIR